MADVCYIKYMPELPEVQTTVLGIRRYARNLSITDVWTNYQSPHHKGKDNIKNPVFFAQFKKIVTGAHITDVTRRAKNILIHLSNNHIILIHMKMTGHVLYGTYKKAPPSHSQPWIAHDPGPLRDDPFNRHIRLVFTLSNGKHLALSDLRKFAKVTYIHKNNVETSKHTGESGPEPLEKSFTYKIFKERLYTKKHSRIKQTLLDHTIIAGIGNIYSDEILWRAGVHPLEKIEHIPEPKLKLMFKATKETLNQGINFGGDSMSDYRNILGERGQFQAQHNAYRKTNLPCSKPRCTGTITRIKVGGRSAHFCNTHQRLAS